MSKPTEENSNLTESDNALMGLLNGWVDDKGGEGLYHGWVLLHLNGGRIAAAQDEMVVVLKDLPTMIPKKVGHTFVCWSNDTDSSDNSESSESSQFDYSDITDLYAEWKINTYTVTFDLGNGTLVNASFTFNTTIVYPNMKGVKGFHGWNVSLELMPARDLAIGPASFSKKSHAGAIAGGVVGGVALIAVIVAVVLFVVLKVSPRNGRRREDEAELTERNPRFVQRINEDSNTAFLASAEPMSNQSKYTDLYPEAYRIPSIEEALSEAGYDRETAELVSEACTFAGKNAEKKGNLFEGFTAEDAAAVALYTYDLGHGGFENNPYRLLNKALTGTTNEGLRKVRGLLYLVMCALRKLPRVRGETLYRGVRSAVDNSEYKVGSVITFQGFSSTSTNMNTVKNFLLSVDDMDNGKKSTGTLFVIEDGWGYDIQPYSLFPNEREILLEPGMYFCVQSVIVSDLTIVNMKMMDVHVILPEVFGDGN